MFAVGRGVRKFAEGVRKVHTNDSLVDNVREVVNRNPRNLELLRIARKPKGFHLDVRKQEFWHKLEFKKYSRYISAEVIHFENGLVVSASSNEGGMKTQLFSLKDSAAYTNLGTLIGKRCIESGIFEVRCDLEADNSANIDAFMKAAEAAGLKLTEPTVYENRVPWFRAKAQEKPWEIFE